MTLRPVQYRYRKGIASRFPMDRRCLGFIIEDTSQGAPFVVERKQVDVYGFASAVLAAL